MSIDSNVDDLWDLLKHLEPWERRILIWHLKRRPSQTPPDPLPYLWCLIGGRNSGKTVTASNHVFEVACKLAATLPFTPENQVIRVALIGETAADVKKTMIEGATGILAVIPPESLLSWNRSQGELTVDLPQSDKMPHQRQIYFTSYSSQKPDQLRGPQLHCAWIDEVAKLEDADQDPQKAGTTFSNLQLALRKGIPHMVVTGTPRPCRLVRYVVEHPNAVVHRMKSVENYDNVPDVVREEWARINPSSRTARQELDAEILDDNPEAVFFADVIDENRQAVPTDDPEMALVLGWDPSVTSGEDSDEAGIILTAWTPERREKRDQSGSGFIPAQAYIIGDRSGRFTPSEQTSLVIKIMLDHDVADLVFETNQGADFILTQLQSELTAQCEAPPIRRELRSKAVRYGSLRRYRYRGIKADGEPFSFVVNAIHATRGKQLRAEVAAMKYDNGQVHHPLEGLSTLEKEMTGWSPLSKKSPNRVDAITYTLLHIFGAKQMLRRAPARLIAPSTEPIRLMPADGIRNRGAVSLYSVDIMENRGPR